MELYLDSVDFKEIEEAFKLGTLAGLTTTPTFLHREGVTDIDATILKLAKMVPILQVEALGDNANEIVAEAKRQIKMGLDPKKTVFKIPVSMEGIKACKMLTSEGLMVNVHLVYTLQQAYMAALAEATYICVLVGRMQDQGHDALTLIAQCNEMINQHGFRSKVMFSSVRHMEHVRNAIELGVHTITVPWSVMKKLTDNNFTSVGTKQFIDHTKLITKKVSDIIRSDNPIVKTTDTVFDASIIMTEAGFGAVSVVEEKTGKLVGVFTDGTIRRELKSSGRWILDKKMSDFEFKSPFTISADALLEQAVAIFKKEHIDTIVVVKDGEVCGMLDVQDLMKLDLLV
ncbi:MAG: transaldolase family protein [Bacteroidota bacterium]|nr:transaldolase family protein [Bacteroidota bacterium]